jgi:RNA polymerase sigma-70 factor (ECF subfamily)
MATFSFEEGYGSDVGGTPFVPASRTKKEDDPILDPADFEPAVSDKVGTLPQDKGTLDAITAAAAKYGVPQEYGLALADQESGYNLAAHNDEYGADGLYQFIPDTAKAYGLKYGVDTRNPAKAADAAMRSFADSMKKGGVEYAIKNHFAGPDESKHGPKTRQYLADVTKRAEDIRALLTNPDAPVDPVSKPKKSNTFSFEEGYGPNLAQQPAKPTQTAPVESGYGEAISSFLGNTSQALVDTAKNTFDFVWQRLQDGPDEYLGKKLVQVERSPQEIDSIIQKEKDTPWYRSSVALLDRNDPEFWNKRREELRFAKVPEGDNTAAIQARKNLPPSTPKEGFFANIENPMKLLTTDSLPANFTKFLTQAPERARENFWKARQIAMQENIVAHPEQFPEVAVQAAQGEINRRRKEQAPGVGEMWHQLKEAAKADPGKFGAQFANALIADPEMLLAPEGIGLKVISGTKRVSSGVEAIGRAAKLADKVVDASSTGAALNLGMEAASKAAHNEEMTASDAGFSAATGFGLSGALGGLFSRGAKARESMAKGEKVDIDSIIADAAKEEVVTENVMNTSGPISNSVKHQIEESTGIKFESDKDLKAYLETTRKEWKKLFDDRDLHGQYQKALAQERMDRAKVLAEEHNSRQQAAAGDAAKADSVESAFVHQREVVRQQYQDEWEKALAARDNAAMAGDHKEAIHENTLRDATAKLDEQEIIDAAYHTSGAVRDAMLRAAHRDSKLRVPKWQRGDVDPRLIARLGIGSLFAGTAYAMAPEDQKMGAAFAAGLAGLLIPGGGSVLDRMRQSGMVSSEGDIIGLLVKEGKLAPDKDLNAARQEEAHLIGRAKQGDQQAFTKLYNDNVPRVKRFVKQFVREAGPRLGVDADDVAQETMVSAFKNLQNFNGTSGFYTWLYAIARNKGLRAIEDARNLKGGGQYQMTSMHAPSGADAPGDLGAGHMEGGNASIKSEVEGAAPDLDTPEGLAIQEETKQQLVVAINNLSAQQRETFILNRIEQYTAQEIADMQGRPINSVLSDIKRAQDSVEAYLAKGYSAKKTVAKPETTVNVQPELPKRGRGRPRLQRGEVDTKLLVTLTGAAGTAALAAYLVDNTDGRHSKKTAALGGAALGLLLFGGGSGGLKSAIKMIDEGAGVASTRLLNASPKIFRRAQNAERRILENTHVHITAVAPFLMRMKKLPKEGQQILTRALLTGNAGVITKVLDAFGDAELKAGYKAVRSVLDSLGDQLTALNRFKKGAGEYFPRVVKDKEGLFKAIGKVEADNLKEILSHANAESIRKNGRPLSQIEEAALINQALFVDKRATQPSWSKHRGIEEITPELLPFYATPVESIHTYIRSAVQDIEKAKFFGRYAKNMPKGQFEFLDVDRSVNNMLAEEIKSGDLTHEQADEIADVLKARFGKGEHGENDLIRNVKNIGNMGLLGNVWSAASQLADVALQVHVQSLTSTLQAVTRQLTGRKIISVKDFGLIDHVSEEFANQLRSTKWLNNVLKGSLFSTIDRFGKNTALNAAIIKARGMAATDSGVLKLANKYQDMFGDDFQKLVSELKGGKITELTKEYAWLELSRTQPISRLEMPTAYLNNPNLRTFWWLKSFTLKQFDLIRRDAYNEIKKGHVAKGMLNLVSAGVAMGVGGAGTQVVKDWMMGRPIKLGMGEVPLNMFRNLGFNQYTLDHLTGVSKEDAKARRAAGDANAKAQRAKPIEALVDVVVPPYKMFQDVLTGDPKAARYLVPGVGPYIAERMRNAEIERKKLEKELYQ